MAILSGAKVRELEAEGLRIVPGEAAHWLVAGIDDPEDGDGDRFQVTCARCGTVDRIPMTEWHWLGDWIVSHARTCGQKGA